MKLVLVHEKTNRPVKVGESLKTFRGEPCVLTSWSEPYDAEFIRAATVPSIEWNLHRGGKIYCQEPGHTHQSQWYPSVCGLKFIVVP